MLVFEFGAQCVYPGLFLAMPDFKGLGDRGSAGYRVA